MTEPQKNRLREMQLAFVGKLMAGLSHENKNHLAIIKESCGLIEDLLLLEEPGTCPDRDRYLRIIAGINERISMAAEMSRHLSTFSHRMDHPLSSFSLAEALREEIYLLHRFARQKQIELLKELAPEGPVIFNNPALLQFLVFCILSPALETLDPGGRILIATNGPGSPAEIIITVSGIAQSQNHAEPDGEALTAAAELLGATLSSRTAPNGDAVTVVTISSIND